MDILVDTKSQNACYQMQCLTSKHTKMLSAPRTRYWGSSQRSRDLLTGTVCYFLADKRRVGEGNRSEKCGLSLSPWNAVASEASLSGTCLRGLLNQSLGWCKAQSSQSSNTTKTNTPRFIIIDVLDWNQASYCMLQTDCVNMVTASLQLNVSSILSNIAPASLTSALSTQRTSTIALLHSPQIHEIA